MRNASELKKGHGRKKKDVVLRVFPFRSKCFWVSSTTKLLLFIFLQLGPFSGASYIGVCVLHCWVHACICACVCYLFRSSLVETKFPNQKLKNYLAVYNVTFLFITLLHKTQPDTRCSSMHKDQALSH